MARGSTTHPSNMIGWAVEIIGPRSVGLRGRCSCRRAEEPDDEYYQHHRDDEADDTGKRTRKSASSVSIKAAAAEHEQDDQDDNNQFHNRASLQAPNNSWNPAAGLSLER